VGAAFAQTEYESHLADAVNAQSSGNIAAAIVSYQSALAIRRDIPEVWANLGLMQHQAGDHAGALSSFKTAYQLQPKLFVPLLFLGIETLQLDNRADAVRYLSMARQLRPNDPEIYMNLGRAYFGLKQFENASVAYQRVTELNAKNGEAWYRLGVTYLEMAEAASLPDQDRLLEICRLAKERLNPNSRRILLDLGEYEAAIPVDDFYARCAAPIDRTIDVVDSVITKVGGVETLSCIYIVGGGSEFPPVARVLRTRFGRRVRKSSYAHAATAIGLAITADMRSEMRIERTFTRNFGVWREAESGTTAFFDTLFPKGCRMPAHSVRRYHPTHNIGHFRYLECDEIDESDRPAGDIAPWDDILFPFEPQLCESAATTTIRISNPAASPLVEEVYACDENGIVKVTIRNLTADYDCVYALRR